MINKVVVMNDKSKSNNTKGPASSSGKPKVRKTTDGVTASFGYKSSKHLTIMKSNTIPKPPKK